MQRHPNAICRLSCHKSPQVGGFFVCLFVCLGFFFVVVLFCFVFLVFVVVVVAWMVGFGLVWLQSHWLGERTDTRYVQSAEICTFLPVVLPLWFGWGKDFTRATRCVLFWVFGVFFFFFRLFVYCFTTITTNLSTPDFRRIPHQHVRILPSSQTVCLWHPTTLTEECPK